MLLTCQKHLFSLPEEVHYLNCATMSPNSKQVEAAGIQGLLRKSQPYEIVQEHFFDTLDQVKSRFASLINCPAERIALMNSVSYGMATAVKNLLKKRNVSAQQKVVMVGEEFPSDVYSWEELQRERGVKIEFVKAPEALEQRGKIWNERLLDAIDHSTLAVCISPTHWADGTRFDLLAIGDRCRQTGAFFAIDGTQHVGAYPFDIQEIKPDFLVCAAYKWLLGPYGNALAYCGEFFDDGTPLEQTWTGRLGSQEFKNLIHYQSEYRPGAYRFNMGEFSNFIQLPMIEAALQHLLEWTPAGIQAYARDLVSGPIEQLRAAGYWIETEPYRANHLFGIRPIGQKDMESIRQTLLREKIFVSYRGSAIRISVHVWNDAEDMKRLVDVLT